MDRLRCQRPNCDVHTHNRKRCPQAASASGGALAWASADSREGQGRVGCLCTRTGVVPKPDDMTPITPFGDTKSARASTVRMGP